VEAVKGGTLKLDPSVTVGDALDGYKYFSSTRWKAFRDRQNRQIVEFRGKIDIDKLVGSQFLDSVLTSEMIRKAKKKLGNPVFTYIAQFAVSKDGKTFALSYNGLHVTGHNSVTGQKIDENVILMGLGMLMPSGIQSIYTNRPFPYVLNELITSGK